MKPFKPAELVARLRRRETDGTEIVKLLDLEIDVGGHAVRRDGRVIPLTPLEFDLLVALARKPRQVLLTRRPCLSRCGGTVTPRTPAWSTVHVQRLRAKVERDPERPEVVMTVRGVG